MTNVNSNVSVDDALAQAAAASQTVAPLENSADAVFSPATAPQTQAYQVAPTAPGTPLSADDNNTNGQAVEHFIKLGDEKVEVNGVDYPGVVCELVMADCSAGGGLRKFVGLNYSKGQTPFYSKSYDGINTNSGEHAGKPWNENIRLVQSIAPNASPFYGFDLALVVHEDTQPCKAGEAVLAKGTILGYSTTPTGSGLVDVAYKKAKQQGHQGDTALVKIMGIETKNNQGTKYKKLSFTVTGYLGDDAVE